MTWLLAGQAQRSVLVSRLRYLGDIVMSTILLEVLRAGDPGLRLGYLCEEGHGAVLADHPCLDRIHLLAAPRRSSDARARLNNSSRSAAQGRGAWAISRELRRADYDLAVDLFFNPRSAWLLRLSGIRARIGGTTSLRRYLYTETALADAARRRWPQLDDIAPGGLGDHLCRLAPLVHAESGLHLLDWVAREFPAGTLRPRLAAEQYPVAVPYVVLAPSATWPSKEWPRRSWRDLIARLVAAGQQRLRLLIPPGRQEMWAELAAGYGPDEVEVLPPSGLLEIKRLLAGASALVAVDGGVMHMGVALGTPTVALFGPTDPGIWFPYEQLGPFRVLATKPACHPCDLHHCGNFVCLPELPAAAVAAKLAELVKS